MLKNKILVGVIASLPSLAGCGGDDASVNPLAPSPVAQSPRGGGVHNRWGRQSAPWAAPRPVSTAG